MAANYAARRQEYKSAKQAAPSRAKKALPMETQAAFPGTDSILYAVQLPV